MVANYGCAAGELAACVTAAGMADYTQLTKLELTGPAAALAAVLGAVTGATLAPGGALLARSAWWCAASGERLIVLSEPWSIPSLHDRLAQGLVQESGVQLRDRSSDWCAIAVLGRRASEVLAALGVYGPSRDPRQTPPFTAAALGEAPTLWLLESDRRAVALVSRREAEPAWRAIERAGRPRAIRYVGQEAAARYALLDRRAAVAAAAFA